MTRRGAPGTRLLDWIGDWSDTPLRWNRDRPRQLFDVLRDGDARAWRFLETTGVLERTLPELADAVDRRRDDPFLLDPAQVLRFSLVERIREVVATDDRGRSRAHGDSRTPSGCCWPRSSSTPPATTRPRWSWPAGSRTASTSAPRPSRRSRCWSATPTCSAPPPAGRRPRRGARVPHRHPPRHARAGPCALSADARARWPRAWDRARLDEFPGRRASCSSSPTSPGSMLATSSSGGVARPSAWPRTTSAWSTGSHARPAVPAQPGGVRRRASGRAPRAGALAGRRQRGGAADRSRSRRGRRRSAASRSRRVIVRACSPPSPA